jgi:tetratricopeptide (TPR) repeat protein
MKQLLLMAGIIILGAGQCAVAGVPVKIRLDACVSYYKDGDYQKAADSIKALLPLIADKRVEAEAYKYLGFSYVMLDQIDQAREFFRVVLEKFPQMTIDTLEVPPNVAIVFKQTRIERQMETGEIVEKKVQEQDRKRTVFATLCTVTGAIGAGAGGYFLYQGYRAHRDYENAINDFNSPWNKMKKDLIIGGCVTVFAAAGLYSGLRLFFKKPSSQKAGLTVNRDRIAVTIDF